MDVAWIWISLKQKDWETIPLLWVVGFLGYLLAKPLPNAFSPRPLPQSFDSFLIIGVHSFFVAICVSLGRYLPNILSGLIFFFKELGFAGRWWHTPF